MNIVKQAAKVMVAIVAVATIAYSANPTATNPCEEDQPCWNCLTMGNHICGGNS